jgi:hypothetical protein
MESISLLGRNLVRAGLRTWQPPTSTQCARSLPRAFFRRTIQTSQHGRAPTQEQLRAQFKNKNRNTLYYTLSTILGTVALSYGSVPFYKMICQQMGWGGQPISIHSAGQYEEDDIASRLIPVTDSRRLHIRRSALEVHSPAEGSPRTARRDCSGFLYRHQFEQRRGYHWCSHILCHSRPGRTVLLKDSMFLFRGAETEQGRDCRHACLLLHRS